MFEYLKGEIERADRVLGPDKGLSQNMIDIRAWKRDGLIDDREERKLHDYACRLARTGR